MFELLFVLCILVLLVNQILGKPLESDTCKSTIGKYILDEEEAFKHLRSWLEKEEIPVGPISLEVYISWREEYFKLESGDYRIFHYSKSNSTMGSFIEKFFAGMLKRLRTKNKVVFFIIFIVLGVLQFVLVQGQAQGIWGDAEWFTDVLVYVNFAIAALTTVRDEPVDKPLSPPSRE